MSEGPFLVEWAERVRSALPQEHLWINMNYLDEEQRSLTFIPAGKRYAGMVEKLRNRVTRNLL